MRADLLFERFVQTSDLGAVLESARLVKARARAPLVSSDPLDFAPLLDEGLFGSGPKERCAYLSVPSGVLHPAVASLLGDLLELEWEGLMRVAQGQALLQDGAVRGRVPGAAPPPDQTGMTAIARLLPRLPPEDPALRSLLAAGVAIPDLVLRTIPVPPPSLRPFRRNDLGQLLPQPDTLCLAALAAATTQAARQQDHPDPSQRLCAELQLQANFEQWIGLLCGLTDWAEWQPLDFESMLAPGDDARATGDGAGAGDPKAADYMRAVHPTVVLAFRSDEARESYQPAPDVQALPDGPDLWLTYPWATVGLDLGDSDATVCVALPSCGLSPTAISANGKRVVFALSSEVAPHAPRRAVYDRESEQWVPKPYPDAPATVLGWVRWYPGSPLDVDFQLMRWRPLFPTLSLAPGGGRFLRSPTGRYVWHTSSAWVVDRDDMLPCLDLRPVLESRPSSKGDPPVEPATGALVCSPFHGWLLAYGGVLYQDLQARFDYGVSHTPVAFDEDARRLYVVDDQRLRVRPLTSAGGQLTCEDGRTYDLRGLRQWLDPTPLATRFADITPSQWRGMLAEHGTLDGLAAATPEALVDATTRPGEAPLSSDLAAQLIEEARRVQLPRSLPCL